MPFRSTYSARRQDRIQKCAFIASGQCESERRSTRTNCVRSPCRLPCRSAPPTVPAVKIEFRSVPSSLPANANPREEALGQTVLDPPVVCHAVPLHLQCPPSRSNSEVCLHRFRPMRIREKKHSDKLC